jgi:hypothetical protein
MTTWTIGRGDLVGAPTRASVSGEQQVLAVEVRGPLEPMAAGQRWANDELRVRQEASLATDPDVIAYRTAVARRVGADETLKAAIAEVARLERERDEVTSTLPPDATARLKTNGSELAAARETLAAWKQAAAGCLAEVKRLRRPAEVAAEAAAKVVYLALKREAEDRRRQAHADVAAVAAKELSELAEASGRCLVFEEGAFVAGDPSPLQRARIRAVDLLTTGGSR